MTQQKAVSNSQSPAVHGGFHVAWLLADDPRTITTKDGTQRTIVELRDPRRLSQSLLFWLDGPAGSLAGAQPGLLLHLHVESIRPGRARGELVGAVSRNAIETALDRAQGTSR